MLVTACSAATDVRTASPSGSVVQPTIRPTGVSSTRPSATPLTTYPSVAPSSLTATPSSSTASPATWQTYTEPFAGQLDQSVDGLFVRSDGALVAWGIDQEDTAGGYASVSFWTAPDWQSWGEIKLEGLGPFIRVHDVAAGPKGIVAAGSREDLGALWWSSDAQTWTLGTLVDSTDIEWSNVLAVAAGGDGYLAVGAHRHQAAAWFSPDGVSWHSVGSDDLPTGQLFDVAAATDGSFIVVGTDDTQQDHDAIVRLVSADGERWTAARPSDAIAGPDDDEISRVWPFAGGFVGYGDLGDAARRHFCERQGGECFPQTSPRLFTSADGITWSVFGDNDLMTPAQRSSVGPSLWEFNAIAANGDGLLAAGAGTDFVVRIWSSADGVTWDPVGDPVDIANHPAPADYQADIVNGLVVDSTRLVIGGQLESSDGYVMIGTPGAI
jgi:hypothetical protein